MTAEEILESYRNKNDWSITDKDTVKAMKEYAYLKCQELLQIVAKKAELKVQKKSQCGKNKKWSKVKEDEELNMFDYQIGYSVDKNSILNAVDLETFCS